MTHPPDCTLTTACFDLSVYASNARDLITAINSMSVLLEVPCYLVIFCDKYTVKQIKHLRNEVFGNEHLTKYIEIGFEDIWTYFLKDKVSKNRTIYFPTQTKRSSVEKHLICCNKFDFVLFSIYWNPFQTTLFGWIDANLGINAKIVRIDYQKNTLLNVLNNLSPNHFQIQVLNVCDKKYKNPKHKKEYYAFNRWVVCGGFFTTNKQCGIPILNRLKDIFVETTLQGFGHNEEMLYLEILDEFQDKIKKSYGDYCHIFNNFTHQTKGFLYVYKKVICKYFEFQYYKECIDCCETMLLEYDDVKFVDDMCVSIYIKYYLSHIFSNSDHTQEVFKKIQTIMAQNKHNQEVFSNKFSQYPQYSHLFVEGFFL